MPSYEPRHSSPTSPADAGSQPRRDPRDPGFSSWQRSSPADVAQPRREAGPVEDRPRPQPGQQPIRSRRPRQAVRRVKRTVKHVDALSVLKLSLFFYAVFLIIWLVLVAILYYFVASTGVFESIEELGRGFAITSLKNLDISLFLIEKYAFFLGLAASVLGCLMNVFIALLYNVAADSIGGVGLTFVEKEL